MERNTKTATEDKMNGISEVVQTIYQQIGASRFFTMVGARNIVHGENLLQFSIRGAQNKINKVVIKYVPGADLYTMEFWNIRGAEFDLIADYELVYADDLTTIFEAQTGLRTRI